MGRASREAKQRRAEQARLAANAAAAPAPPPPPSRWKKVAQRFSGFPRIALGVGLLQILWRWAIILFRRGEDTQFALDLWRGAGGDVPMLVQAVSSPFFGLALIVASIGYAFFGKEPSKKVEVHPAIPAVGWFVVILCGVLVGSVILFDMFLRQSHVAQFVADLTTERHVTETQRADLKRYLAPDAASFTHILDVAAAQNPEATGYAIELMTALALAGLKVRTLDTNIIRPIPMNALNTGVKGVFILVVDQKQPPKEAATLFDALNKSGIKTTYWYAPQFFLDQYSLTVGLR